MTKRKSIISIFIAVFLAFVLLFTGIMPVIASADDSSSSSSSATIEYSNVLDDLKKDSSFDETLYPVVSENYTLSVITVAESENLQLFVYVYQPSYGHKTLVASSINISTELHNRLSFKNYKLSLVSQDGVFQKYIVKGLIVNADEVRHYEISSIFRVWDSVIDKDLEPTNDNTIVEVSFAVAKQFTIAQEDGVLRLHVEETEYITITDKFVGFVRYEDGFRFWIDDSGCDSHFIAFSTDKPIEKLYEADVYFEKQHYLHEQTGGSLSVGGVFGSPEEGYAYLNYKQDGEYTGDGLFANTYTFSRISTVDDFIDEVESETIYKAGIFNISQSTKITDEGMESLKRKKWVLRFTETAYECYDNSIPSLGVVETKEEFTIITSATILRLAFETGGISYNLGVVDNKQSGSRTPIDSTEWRFEMNDWFEKLLTILLVIGLVVLYGTFLAPFINPIISMIIKAALKGIGIAIKWIFWLLTLPLRLLFGLFKKR